MDSFHRQDFFLTFPDFFWLFPDSCQIPRHTQVYRQVVNLEVAAVVVATAVKSNRVSRRHQPCDCSTPPHRHRHHTWPPMYRPSPHHSHVVSSSRCCCIRPSPDAREHSSPPTAARSSPRISSTVSTKHVFIVLVHSSQSAYNTYTHKHV